MRRRLLLGAAGAAAAGAGLGWRLWRDPAGDAAPDEATWTFWQSSFARPEGGELAMAALRGQPLVLNFWATWCPPCVKEMPELDRFARAFAGRGGRVVGLAVDNPTAVRQFLVRTPVSYAVGLAGFDGTELSRKLGNANGALPFTAVFDRQGRILQRKLGETSHDQLLAWTSGL